MKVVLVFVAISFAFSHLVLADQIFPFLVGGSFSRGSREPKYNIKLHSEDSPYTPDDNQESVVMPNSNGQSYICHLPKVEKAKSGKPVSQHNISSLIVESEKRIKLKTPDELLEELKDQCFVRQEGWWSYEFCYQKRVRQVHLEDEKVVQEFVLGQYDAEATAAFNRNLSDISTLKDPRSKDASQRHDFLNIKFDGRVREKNTFYKNHDRLRYDIVSAIYQGFELRNWVLSHFALVRQGISLKVVRFVCSEPRAMISSFTEVSTCKYALTVRSPMLCQHPLFQEERPVWYTIHCNVLPKDDKEAKGVEELKNEEIVMHRGIGAVVRNSGAGEVVGTMLSALIGGFTPFAAESLPNPLALSLLLLSLTRPMLSNWLCFVNLIWQLRARW
ncbi:hypothetical protein TIFTF001_016559 [Ficus carica]|uniref:MRH domain-containing protein n=1 Tax=Ficus carica TaxID=3494 RepID=A0AA88AJS4_FICCA|nr:hypothetical protein TIFTF001_016559 [Ficus carica]